MNTTVKLWYQGTYNSWMSTPTLELEYDYSTDVLTHRFIPDYGRGEQNDQYWTAQKLDDCDVTAIKELLRDKDVILNHLKQTSSRPIERRGAHIVTDRICVEFLGVVYETERPTQTELLNRIVAIYSKYTRRHLYGDEPHKGLSLVDFLENIGDPVEREKVEKEIEEMMSDYEDTGALKESNE